MAKKKSPTGVGRKKQAEIEQAAIKVFDLIKDTPHSTLIRIGCAINRREWVDELPGKPDGWDEMSPDEKHLWAKPIFLGIEACVGYKSLLRYYHTVEGKMTNRQFEDWWDSHHHSRF